MFLTKLTRLVFFAFFTAVCAAIDIADFGIRFAFYNFAAVVAALCTRFGSHLEISLGVLG